MKMFKWNSTKTGLFNVIMVRNFEFKVKDDGIELIAWFNDKETLNLGLFSSFQKAKEFLKSLEDE